MRVARWKAAYALGVLGTLVFVPITFVCLWFVERSESLRERAEIALLHARAHDKVLRARRGGSR